jgi:DNA end-binding protein Ku
MWKGNISFGLVMIPVNMYSAEAKAVQIDLDMIDSRDRQRIRYRRVNEKTGKEVPWKSIAKGYLHDDEYVIITDADFKKAGEEIVRGIEMLEFVPADSISPLYYQRPYYLAPGKGGEKAYALLRDTLLKTKQVGIAKAVIHSREHLAALTVVENVLALVLLRFADELRSPSDLEIKAPAKGKVNARELTMAQELVKGMSGEWKPEQYHDEYRDALKGFIEEKIRSGGKAPKRTAADEEEEEAPASYNIMELLKKSVQQKKPARATKQAKTSKTKRKAG